MLKMNNFPCHFCIDLHLLSLLLSFHCCISFKGHLIVQEFMYLCVFSVSFTESGIASYIHVHTCIRSLRKAGFITS